MEWTKEKPRKEGCYWFLSIRETKYPQAIKKGFMESIILVPKPD